MEYTASLVKFNIDEKLATRRAEALARGIPVADDETLQFLLLTLAMTKPQRILEIGTAVGLSGVAALLACPSAKLTTIELEEERYLEAKKNFADFASCGPASSIQDTEELNSHDSEGSGGDCSILMKEEGDAGWPSEALWKNLWVSTLTRV